MKVQNKTIYMGDNIRNESSGENGSFKRKSLDGTALQAKFEPIEAKREEAKKKAMKIVGNAFSNELKIDDELNSRRERIKSLQREIGDANQGIKDIEDRRKSLRDLFGVDEDSQEEKELKLLEKEVRAKMPGNNVHYNKGDFEKIAELKKNGLTEYQKKSLEMLGFEYPYETTLFENNREIMVENQIISATKLERLKTHPIADAQKQADSIMDEASREIVGMAVDEAKDKIDEETKEEKDKAEAQKEKKEEIQDRIDAVRAEKKENEKLTEDILDGVAEATSTANDVNAAQQEIKNMMSKMRLIEEDIKGAAVDKNI